MLLVVCPQATYYIKYDNLKSVFNKKKEKKKEVKWCYLNDKSTF
jgi:hypothetical protein